MINFLLWENSQLLLILFKTQQNYWGFQVLGWLNVVGGGRFGIVICGGDRQWLQLRTVKILNDNCVVSLYLKR